MSDCERVRRAHYLVNDIVIVPCTLLIGHGPMHGLMSATYKCTIEHRVFDLYLLSASSTGPGTQFAFISSFFFMFASFVLVYLRRIFLCTLFGARLRVFSLLPFSDRSAACIIAFGKQTCPKWSLHFHFIHSFAFLILFCSLRFSSMPFRFTLFSFSMDLRFCAANSQLCIRIAVSSRFMRTHCEIFPLL